MKIDCISDLHGFYPKLEGGDLLIIAGDLTRNDTIPAWKEFFMWLDVQDYRKKILIGGNHDNFLEQSISDEKARSMGIYIEGEDYEYLCDSGTEFEGMKIWGSPWTPWFDGVNPRCEAFMKKDDKLSKYWKLIPSDTDILITHGPPYGVRDMIECAFSGTRECAGSRSLQIEALKFHCLKLWVFGHIHEGYGKDLPGGLYSDNMINASYVNANYKPVNKPIRIEL